MKHHIVLELPIGQVYIDPADHLSLGTPEEDGALESSIAAHGIIDPLITSRQGRERYVVIDGRRRLRVAHELGLKTVFCVVHERMSAGAREALRLTLHLTFKPLSREEQVRQRRRLRDLGVLPTS